MIKFKTFEERLEYLELKGQVGASTFGFDRYLNQKFYKSHEWQDVRRKVIARDDGCDLAVPGYYVFDRVLIHHMNPMSADEIKHHSEDILNPDYLVCVSLVTHNAIHFQDNSIFRNLPKERTPGDMIPWKKRT